MEVKATAMSINGFHIGKAVNSIGKELTSMGNEANSMENDLFHIENAVDPM